MNSLILRNIPRCWYEMLMNDIDKSATQTIREQFPGFVFRVRTMVRTEYLVHRVIEFSYNQTPLCVATSVLYLNEPVLHWLDQCPTTPLGDILSKHKQRRIVLQSTGSQRSYLLEGDINGVITECFYHG